MKSFLEICDRFETGEKVSEETFDLERLFLILRRLIGKYNIKYDPDNPVPFDDALADRVFEAAVEFFTECGVFCKDTSRIARFSREEILTSVADFNGDCRLGEGKDAEVLRSRKPDSSTRPWYHVGSGIIASTEEIAFKTVEGNASIQGANSMSVPALQQIAGHNICAGQPSEIFGAIRSIKIARDACRQAGRPGLPITNGIATAGTTQGTIAASNPDFGMRPSDGWIVGPLAQMKTSWEMLCKAAYIINSGGNVVMGGVPFVGGYAGGPEGVAILTTALTFFGILIYRCCYYLACAMQLALGCSSTRDVIWALSGASQAIARNTNVPTINLFYIAGGPWTKSFFYESSALIAASIASGVSTQSPHPAKAIHPDYVTPLEMQTNVEVERACTGMTRKEANQIVKALLPKYEDGLAAASKGKKYTECFNINSGTPKPEYIDFVAGIKKELSETGIPV